MRFKLFKFNFSVRQKIGVKREMLAVLFYYLTSFWDKKNIFVLIWTVLLYTFISKSNGCICLKASFSDLNLSLLPREPTWLCCVLPILPILTAAVVSLPIPLLHLTHKLQVYISLLFLSSAQVGDKWVSTTLTVSIVLEHCSRNENLS